MKSQMILSRLKEKTKMIFDTYFYSRHEKKIEELCSRCTLNLRVTYTQIIIPLRIIGANDETF